MRKRSKSVSHIGETCDLVKEFFFIILETFHLAAYLFPVVKTKYCSILILAFINIVDPCLMEV